MNAPSISDLSYAVRQYIAQQSQKGHGSSQIETDAATIKAATAGRADAAVPVRTIVEQQNAEVVRQIRETPLATEGSIGTRINTYA